ncbi:uncharacterized protein LOC132903104 [Amyelois transitella]|uniref:uncharacterized protein LOC132903104 n=1 Tax=Amyelois transitella TaxID=680683 RepID=UPI0029904750|nr:uncharacterized protein LOC132903104 [Amyelois transitella]
MWHFVAIEECDNPELYELKWSVAKQKISRTVEIYNGSLNLDFVLDSSYSLHVDVAKQTEGGWKDYNMIKHDCMLCFCKDNGGKNVEAFMGCMQIESTDEIPAGAHSCSGFQIEFCDLPEDGIIGEFRAKVTTIDRNGVIVACAMLYANFTDEVCDKEEEE